MKKTKKNHIQIVCMLVMMLFCISLFPTKTEASEIKIYGDFKYCYNEEYDGIEIVKYKGNAKTVKIPEYIDETPVKVIGEECFKRGGLWTKNKTLKKVILPETVLVVGSYAFSGCVNLKSVNLPKNLQSLGEWAFHNCSSLKTIEIPKTLEVLTKACFADSGLKELVIPKNIKTMDFFVFSGCRELKKVTFEKKSKLKSIGWQAFCSCESLTNIKLPASLEVLDAEVFRNCDNLKKVTFEKSAKLKKIGYACFQYCDNLTTIVVPKNVKVIDQYAFINCDTLVKVTFKGPAPKIRGGAFKGVNPNITFKVPKKYKSKYKKLLKSKKWFKETMQIVSV